MQGGREREKAEDEGGRGRERRRVGKKERGKEEGEGRTGKKRKKVENRDNKEATFSYSQFFDSLTS